MNYKIATYQKVKSATSLLLYFMFAFLIAGNPHVEPKVIYTALSGIVYGYIFEFRPAAFGHTETVINEGISISETAIPIRLMPIAATTIEFFLVFIVMMKWVFIRSNIGVNAILYVFAVFAMARLLQLLGQLWTKRP